jgi:hypothetical protein
MKPNRKSIRQASPATVRISPQWKDALKQKCLNAARQKRSKRVAQRRQPSPALNLQNPDDRNKTVGGSLDSSPGATRALIQEQFQATGVAVISSSVDPGNDFHTPQFTLVDNSKLEALRRSQPGTNLFPEKDGTYITEDDLFSLMVEIEEELQRDEG